MVSEDDIVKYALGLADVSERRDGALRIFTRGEKIFLVIETGTDPLRIETRCDRRLSKTLQEQYESVMESRALGRNGFKKSKKSLSRSCRGDRLRDIYSFSLRSLFHS